MLAWLPVWSEVQMICIWSSWCHCHPIISCFVKTRIGAILTRSVIQLHDIRITKRCQHALIWLQYVRKITENSHRTEVTLNVVNYSDQRAETAENDETSTACTSTVLFILFIHLVRFASVIQHQDRSIINRAYCSRKASSCTSSNCKYVYTKFNVVWQLGQPMN